jgi:hypothetical protein
MSRDAKSEDKSTDKVKDLPKKELDSDEADKVRGGGMRRTGDDDDINDLEIQR